MKILLLSLGTHPAKGGVDTYINLVRDSLQSRGHTVDLLCYNEFQNLPDDSHRRIYAFSHLARERLSSIAPYPYIEFEIQRFAHIEIFKHFPVSSYNILHSQSGIISKVAKDLYPEIPLVGTIHSCLYTESLMHGWTKNHQEAMFLRNYDQYAVDSPDKVICISNQEDENMVPIPQNKKVILFNSIETEEFSPKKKDNDTLRICTSGMLVHLKGYDIFLRALCMIQDHLHNTEIDIYGDGPDKQKLCSFAEKHHLPVNFKGYIDRNSLKKELGKYHIFVQPSRIEAFGLSVTEAMASGCAVVCSNVGGMLDQVEDEVNGFLFPSEKAEELAIKLLKLISNRELIEKFGSKGLQIAHTKFSIKSYAQQLEEIYFSLLP